MTEPKRIPASEQSLPERLRDQAQGIRDRCPCQAPCDQCVKDSELMNSSASAIERQQAERGKPFFVEGVGFRSPDEAVMHLLAERAQTKAELERLRGHSEKFEKQRDSYKVQLDQVAQAVYPNKTDRFTYSVDFIIEEIKRLRGELKEKETK